MTLTIYLVKCGVCKKELGWSYTSHHDKDIACIDCHREGRMHMMNIRELRY